MHKHKRYPMRVPQRAPGIRSQESRATVSRSHWGAEWQAALAAMNLGSRLGRGRNYALSGQVLDIRIDCGVVTAEVQGVRDDAYRVELKFRQFPAAAHRRMVAALRAEPMLVARLLADDFPLEVEELFRKEGFSPYPGGKLGPCRYDVTTACTCPDWMNPCKHSAAVLLLLGEEISRRPMLLLELRGITVAELVSEEKSE